MRIDNEGVRTADLRDINSGDSFDGISAFGTLITQRTDRTVSLQQVFPRAEVYTVEFSIEPNPARSVATKAEATIEWAVGGNIVRRKVTVGNGTSLSGPAKAVTVTVKDVTPISAPLDNTEYKVGIMVSRGVRIATIPTQLESTQNPQSVAGVGASVDFAIPQGVGITAFNVQVINTPTAAIADMGVIVNQQDLIGGVALSSCDPRQMQWIPIANGADNINIMNRTAVQQTYWVTFAIDG